jgi:alkylation response protein AidB-like acyl-CoA dehydrogenase
MRCLRRSGSPGRAYGTFSGFPHFLLTPKTWRSAPPLREQQLAQNQIVKAKAQVEASRDTSIAPPAMKIASSGGPLLSEAKVRLQLALSFAAEACAEALRLVSDAIGTSLIRLENSFERHFRDGPRAVAIRR